MTVTVTDGQVPQQVQKWLARQNFIVLETRDPRVWCLSQEPEGSELRLDWVFRWEAIHPPSIGDALQVLADEGEYTG